MNQLITFTGLGPSIKESGGHSGTHGPISKRGSPILRNALYRASFGAFSHQPMKALYEKYKERSAPQCDSVRAVMEESAHRCIANKEAQSFRREVLIHRGKLTRHNWSSGLFPLWLRAPRFVCAALSSHSALSGLEAALVWGKEGILSPALGSSRSLQVPQSTTPLLVFIFVFILCRFRFYTARLRRGSALVLSRGRS